MDQVSAALVTAGGSMVGATLAQIVVRILNTRRENAIKWGEARARLADLQWAKENDPTPEQEQVFREKYNEHTLWMLTASAYLTPQQRRDIQMLKASLIMPKGYDPTKQDFEEWMAANSRVFPGVRRATKSGFERWFETLWAKYLADNDHRPRLDR